MIPVIVIRPEPGCTATLAAVRDMDLPAHGYSLFAVCPVAWEPVERDEVDALLIGSANALRHGGPALDRYKGMPAYTVGEASARAAREAGLEVVATGTGGIQSLMDGLRPEHRRLLRLAGHKRVDLTPPDHVTLVERTVYSSDPQSMPDALATLLRKPAVVLLHSAEAARHFASCCENRDIDRSNIALAAIGPRVARAAGDGWARVETAERPREEALLALAEQMCQEDSAGANNRQGRMQEDTPREALPTQQPKRSSRTSLLVALLAFALGAGAAGWLTWQGNFDNYLTRAERAGANPVAQAGQPETGSGEEDTLEGDEGEASSSLQQNNLGTFEGRVAMLEDRLSRLNLQATAASGNAARAESLLIAFAARRMIDRGEPLRYLDDQLRLRFANAQPAAVETIIEFSRNPVTLDQLSARIEALSPQLTQSMEEDSGWTKFRRDLGDLFVIRRDRSPSRSPKARIDNAQIMLTARRIEDAIAQVQRLPGADAAERWIADARRYAAAQKALDLIETAAMLEPRRLQDSEGKQVSQRSPIAPSRDEAKEVQGEENE